MSNTQNGSIPEQQDGRSEVVEYGPDVPLAVRLEHELDLLHST